MDITYYKRYEPIFGEWRIVREIGSGSFGKVFEIEREDFGYTYKAALKAVTIPQNQSELDSVLDDSVDEQTATDYLNSVVEEFVEEFVFMSKLKGESNIVSYEDHRVIRHENGIGWDILIRMELLTPLMKYTKEHSLTQQDVIRLGIDICKALELCRRSGIIHRDIKPENIFVSESGKFKLGDFGIARTVEKTQSGLSKKGTFYYMAPEVYKGDEYGPSVDIYSLGIVLYRYLNNNRVPFLPQYPAAISHSDKALAISRRIKGDAIPAPANADKQLADIVLKACAYDPKDRYALPTEMRRALEALAVEDALMCSEAKLIPEEAVATVVTGETEVLHHDATQLIRDEPTQCDTKKTPRIDEEAKQDSPAVSKKGLVPKYLVSAALVAVVIITSAVILGGSPSQSEKEPVQTSQVQPTDENNNSAAATPTAGTTNSSGMSATKKPKTAKWSEWSEWGNEAIEPSNTVEVEERTVYVYQLYRYSMQYGKMISGKVEINMVSYVYRALINEQGYTKDEANEIVKPMYQCCKGNETYENAAASIAPYGFSLVYETKTAKVTEPLEFTESSEAYMSTTVDGETWFSTADTTYGTETQYRARTKG